MQYTVAHSSTLKLILAAAHISVDKLPHGGQLQTGRQLGCKLRISRLPDHLCVVVEDHKG